MAQVLPADLQPKIDTRASMLRAWGADPVIVAAVKAYNAAPPGGSKAMTNDKWSSVTIIDALVRSLTRNPVALHIKAKTDEAIAECFVSGADGGKVAFLAKTTSWSHRGKPKHEEPMAGKVWIGPVEMDQSTGVKQIQIGVPVVDGDHPIGSIVAGFNVAKLK
jgi:hypothetical protein